ncbi:MAG: hypothetical protein KAS29_07675 [Bacteroidales bacterium]|nr:hypothetical protein [Bacteroidales bacterium]
MKTQAKIVASFLVILAVISGCKKNDPDDISLEINLTDEFGATKSQFSLNDSLIFEFHLSNHTGIEATYLRPCSEFRDYLSIYREDPENNYVYYGRPEYHCAAVVVYLQISDDETILIGRIPWSTDNGWPEIAPGKYYVGDTMSLMINDSRHEYIERIYFEIQ